MSLQLRHFYSNEWCKDQNATDQETLQKIAAQIRANCKVDEICEPDSLGSICTVYRNEALGLKYWVKDTFGHISEIDEARYF